MDVNFRKFASEAGTFFNRAKQYTEEKFGHAEKTELDAHFENLLQRSDTTKNWTEKILGQTEAILQPNPTVRYEEAFYTKLDKKRRDRVTNVELLGQHMIDAGNDFGPGTSYGSALVKVGQTEQKLGQAEKEFVQSTCNNFLQPLKGFLEGDMKTVQRERKELENRRLDLDAAKTRLRRVNDVAGKTKPSEETYAALKGALPQAVQDTDDIIAKAELDLRTAQSEFDRQAEITKLLLEGISSTHAHHLRCLHDLAEAQSNYYAQCHQYMSDLQRQLGSFGGGSGSLNHYQQRVGDGNLSPNVMSQPPPIPSAPVQNSTGPRRAKVLYDYDAGNASELSLIADELITVTPEEVGSDWGYAQRGQQYGRIPLTYVEFV